MANGDAHQPIPTDPPESDELRWEWVVRLWYTQKDIRGEVLKLRGEVGSLQDQLYERIRGANEEHDAMEELKAQISSIAASVATLTKVRDQFTGGYKLSRVIFGAIAWVGIVLATLLGSVWASRITH